MALKISRILHAGYIFESSGVKIAFDPIFESPFSGNCHAFPPVRFDLNRISKLELAAVFISHFHDDHCSLESLNLLDKDTPIFLFCEHPELFAWIRELGFHRVTPLKIDSPVQLGPFQVTARRALDREVDCLFQIQTAGANVLNVVDSWIDDETLKDLAREGPWDLVLWPFQTMQELQILTPTRTRFEAAEIPKEWLEQLEALNPKCVVPSSCQFQMEDWSWYNQRFFPVSYKMFADEVQRRIPETEILRLDPGQSVSFENGQWAPSTPLPWIDLLNKSQPDYVYPEHVTIPPTRDIAKHFPALTPDQREEVFEYCETGIVHRFAAFEPELEGYFTKPRVWRLSVYDSSGAVTHFDYRLQGNHLERIDDSTGFQWLTEVPAFKLHGALSEGESLTSMYLRINDGEFSTEAENDLKDLDCVQEDPLIRSLFNGVFGAYQRAQLRRIQGEIS